MNLNQGEKTMNNLEGIKLKANLFAPVGSRITCNPPPTDTDEDFLVFVHPENFNDFENYLLESGYEFGGSIIHKGGCENGDPRSFQSYKYGVTNIIATGSTEFYEKFIEATAIAKHLNLLHKPSRIALFQAVLYGAF